MFHENSPGKCRVIKKITDHEIFYCLKPANITLVLHSPEPLVLCMDCAREMAKEIIDSVPGARCDVTRRRK